MTRPERSGETAELARLSPAQHAALRHVRDVAGSRQSAARRILSTILENTGCSERLFDAAMDSVRQHARVVLHFHPDRFGTKPCTVAEALLHEGRYRNQFETGLSSGSRSAFPGGARDVWERDLFGGAYHASEASDERPKYGALELIRHPDGPWPRFGSCYFVLRTTVSRRTSFTFAGSEQALASERLGLIDAMDCVMAPLLAEIARGEGAQVPWPPFAAPTLGVRDLTVPGLLEYLMRELPSSRRDPSTALPGRTLDTGVEAQVHGPIDLGRDVERLVADPSFRGTSTGQCLQEISRVYSVPLDWHGGFSLSAQEVPEDFRGPAIPRLARRIAPQGGLDAAVIGGAEASLRSHPDSWREWGPHEETMQQLKQLWHVLVHYGRRPPPEP